MKRLFFIIVLCLGFSDAEAQEIKREVIKPVAQKALVVKKVVPISKIPAEQHKTLSNEKSRAITSISTYLKKLQSRRKETLVS